MLNILLNSRIWGHPILLRQNDINTILQFLSSSSIHFSHLSCICFARQHLPQEEFANWKCWASTTESACWNMLNLCWCLPRNGEPSRISAPHTTYTTTRQPPMATPEQCDLNPGALHKILYCFVKNRMAVPDDDSPLETYILYLVGGWAYPSEKYESQLGLLFPIYGKIKNVPNHQPDIHL